MSNRQLLDACSIKTGKTPAQIIIDAVHNVTVPFSNEEDVISQNMVRYASNGYLPDYVRLHCEQILGQDDLAKLCKRLTALGIDCS